MTYGHPSLQDAQGAYIVYLTRKGVRVWWGALVVEEYQGLVKAHIMFKDMADDPYLASAGIASDWPHGRGCYISADKQFIVWVGEEDHLRIMCMKTGAPPRPAYPMRDQSGRYE
jgi:hypothetical protein